MQDRPSLILFCGSRILESSYRLLVVGSPGHRSRTVSLLPGDLVAVLLAAGHEPEAFAVPELQRAAA
jgi:hypothetical protein